MIFNHEDGNWKNSEIARAMMDILASSSVAEDPQSVVDATEASDDSELIAAARQELNEFHRTEASHLIINELNKIAETVQDNPQASLEIELAIEDIKELLK